MRQLRSRAGFGDFSPRGRGHVLLVALVGTLGTMAVALLTVGYTTQFMTGDARTLSFLAALVLPVVVSGPVFYVFADKLRQLAAAHHALAIIASQDSLTTVLNRGAFVTLVDACLHEARARQACAGGLLVIDADHFKQVNDRYGHAQGDAALRLIADGIRDSLRAADLVGRVGGEEFAVFLPGADRHEAAIVAERIRTRVRRIDFRPGGRPTPLTISIGGVMFSGPVAFADLFSAADARLYAAKEAGRDRIDIGGLLPDTVAQSPVRLAATG
jgi:diguanylate cyclase (GGDEF)-like protein